ncbi:symplekin-like [Zingiber officinale]|uniref:symplekin-like n=1 Tax=Zingiber officinale TaxID=94328 RepID=UPI001C4CFB17|nr:symplekin-like [Zingiber officinale]
MATEDGGGMAEGFEASVEGRDALPEIGVAVARDSLRAIELLKDLGSKVSEELTVLMPNLLTTLRHPDLFVVKQSISSGTALFGAVLEEIALQLHGSGKIEHWLEELWSWMVRFKDSVSAILMEPGSIGIKMPALKFIEACILYFTPCEDNGVSSTEGKFMRFNVSHLSSNNSILNPAVLETEADRALDFLLDVLLSANTFCGSFVIAVINILATIVKRRPLRYKVILSALISLNPNFESQKGGHASSIRYSLRTAFVGFLRCNHPFFTESKEKIIRALHAIIPGESVDQIVRQVERMSRTMDRVSHEIRSNKGESPAVQDFQIGDQIRSKISRLPSDAPFEELPSKRIRFEVPSNMAHSTQMTSALPDDNDDGNGDYSSSTSLVDGDSSAAAKMISMIGALLAEGKRGAESLELLVSNIHADLMADIVIETMKHLPKNLMVVSVWHNNAPLNEEIPSSSFSSQVVPTTTSVSVPIPSLSPELASNAVGANGVGTPDTSPVSNLAAEVRRDPRRDPRRLDPRRPGPVGSLHSAPLNSESSSDVQPGPSQDSSKAVPTAEAIIAEQSSMPLASKTEVEPSEIPDTKGMGKMQSLETSEDQDMALEQTSDVHTPASSTSEQAVEEQLAASTPSDVTANDDVNLPESDEFVSADINSLGPEENFHNLIAHPPLFELIDEQKTNLHRLAVTRIIEDYKKIHVTGSSQACLPLLARLIAHTGVDEDILKFLEEHIVLDYPHHKGHELAMHVLYYLQAIVISKADNCSSAASSYEKFLLGIAKALLDSLPATDKSFSKLLVEAPILPDSSLKLLEGLCHSNCNEHRLEETLDGDRVTQGLVATWSLILGRPSYREACLDIALKCAVHPQEEVRAKAIRLVANKLYLLNYASDSIEQFAMRMLLFVVEQQNFEEDINAQNSSDQQTEDTLVGGPRPSEPASSESENNKDNQASEMKVPALSLSQAQQKTSLFFALCSKKPSLLQFVFDIYGRAPKAVKQSIHQHIPFIVKNLSTYSELLKLISDPSEGSKNLIVLVLETLTEEATPSSELIAAVKHLYETKLKDAVILIPMLSSFSKDEVLPIFPRLVDLPLEKFQAALARILQGSAHTGPALTPAEVLIAIHNINPQRDGVALKKITDACTACFEQRIVFTQHVIAKSLNHLVEQVPLPLLFMRTVIQAIDAFPPLVDFVMSILSKLVTQQIWKMPKLWVGFLKCAAQTQPRSFNVLLQLPSPHLESALNRHPQLRTPLSAYANQPNLRTSLPRQTLKLLGLLDETQDDTRSSVPTTLQAPETKSSIHVASNS